jgi:hypothetical protein
MPGAYDRSLAVVAPPYRSFEVLPDFVLRNHGSFPVSASQYSYIGNFRTWRRGSQLVNETILGSAGPRARHQVIHRLTGGDVVNSGIP